ncbi:MAG: hypothetical protein AAFY33_12185, partial [Cyanobacteria bacterium J06643_4]
MWTKTERRRTLSGHPKADEAGTGGQKSNQLLTNQLLTNQLLTNQLLTNQLLTNQLLTNQLL